MTNEMHNAHPLPPMDAKPGLGGHTAARHHCLTCRWWDMHSLSLRKGDCRVPGDHRYSHVKMTTVRPDGSVYRSVAYLDSFGREETTPDYVCGAWDDGARSAIARATQDTRHDG